MSAEIKHAIDRLRYKMPTRTPFRTDILLVCDAAEAMLSIARVGAPCPQCARARKQSRERQLRSRGQRAAALDKT